MVHHKRRFCVKRVTSVEELVEQLHNHTWTLCTGFQIGKYLWLNDSFREDGAQEYAVFMPNDIGMYIDIESITVSWCSIERLCEHINTCLSGAWDVNRYGEYILHIDSPEEHRRCPLCA